MEEGTAIEGPRTLAELDDAIADLQLRLSDYALAFDVDLGDQLALLSLLRELMRATLIGKPAKLMSEAIPVLALFGPLVTEMRANITDRATTFVLTERLREELGAYLHEARRVIASRATGADRDRVLPALADIFSRLGPTETDEAVMRARRAQEAAEESAERARAAAGDTATHGLAGEYQEIADHELGTANWYRWGTIGLLVVSAVESAYFALGFEDLETSQIVARLAIAVPLLALAAYLGRESAQHRQLARAYRSTAVQLKTVGAYADMLGDEGEHELLLLLGKAVYTGPPATPDAEDEAATTAIPLVDLIPLLQGLLGRPAEKLS